MTTRDKYREQASSLSRSPSSPLHNHNLFPGLDSSSSYFSNGLCFSDDGSSSQLTSSGDHDLGLCESLHRLHIRQEEVEKTHHQKQHGGLRFGASSVFGVDKPSMFHNENWSSVGSMVHGKGGVGTLFDHQGRSTSWGSNVYPSMRKILEIQGYVYLMAKDQNGCRYLQRVFEEGTALEAMVVYNEVIPHVVELMMDPFGNYLMQKLLDFCNEEQRTQIVLMVTSEPGTLIRISLNAYGTRVVQRLVETIKTRYQISLVKSALRHGFLNLIRDMNGNHVIQRCLHCLSTEDNEFIFDNATKYCIDIATHRHGCCVLQKCIVYSIGEKREKLITEISRNSLFLAQDPYGNYAVQFVIELREFSAISMVLAVLKGNYVKLSMQKFSSHLVERCLTHCPESRYQIVLELISVPHFDHLIQDPYANFVIQAALDVTKGLLHATLVEVIRPHSILRNNPYCKRIFSRNL